MYYFSAIQDPIKNSSLIDELILLNIKHAIFIQYGNRKDDTNQKLRIIEYSDDEGNQMEKKDEKEKEIKVYYKNIIYT